MSLPRTLLSLLALFLLQSSLFGQGECTQLKVMTYNIWNGFDWGKDTARQKNWIDWINRKDPDVLALQELCGFTEEKLKTEAAKWGHPYAAILKEKGYPVGITSKEPIVVKERLLQGLWHGMMQAETFGIDFFVVHLSPADVDFRHKEASIITRKIQESGSDHFIVLGDFNAHSPFDGEALKVNASLLKKSAPKPESKYSNLRLGEFDYAVISSFLALPTIDVAQKYVDISRRFTFPTPTLIGLYQTAEEVNQNKERIDYLLASPNLSTSCTRVQIYNAKETGSLSDHYPLMATFHF